MLREGVGVPVGRRPRSLGAGVAHPTHLLRLPSGVEDHLSSCLGPRASGVPAVVAEGRRGCPSGGHPGARPGIRRHPLGSLPHRDMAGVVHHSLPGQVVVVVPHGSWDRRAVRPVGTVSVGRTHPENQA